MAVEALSGATDAMKSATDAMTRASEALYISTMVTLDSIRGLGQISDFKGQKLTPARISSVNAPRLHIAAEFDKTPTNPQIENGEKNIDHSDHIQSKIISHVDLMDAVSRLRNEQEGGPENSFGFRGGRYGEDIADRNIGSLYIESTRSDHSEPIIPQLTPRSQTTGAHGLGMCTFREIILVITICMAHFLTQAGLSQVIAPLHLIGTSFSSASSQPSLSWYAAAFSLTVGTFILPSGRFGDVFGHKLLFIIGWIWYAIFSLLAGFAPRIQANGAHGEVFFIVCRAMQGIGPALLMPNALAILGRIYPQGNKKNMIFALFGASAPAGFVVGAVMASLLSQKASWSWIFWMMALVCTLMALLSFVIIPIIPSHGASSTDSSNLPLWTLLDLPGSVLGICALILVNVALNQAPLVSWATPYTYFVLIIGLLLLAAFLFIEFHPSISPHPLIPKAALSLDTTFVLACTACGWSCFGIWIFYTWEFLETLRRLSPLSVSAQFVPAPIFGLIASVCTGILLSKTTPQLIMLLSMLAFFTGTTIVATAPVAQVYWAQVFFSILIMPFGMDLSFPSATILLSNRAGHEHQGVAASLVNTVVNYSISIGLGLAGTVQRSYVEENDALGGIRSAWYLGMGLSGAGIGVAVIFVALEAMRMKRGRGGKAHEQDKI